MQSVFSVGQFVRYRAAAGVFEVVRILPVLEDGMVLYLIRGTRGDEAIARHHEIQKA